MKTLYIALPMIALLSLSMVSFAQGPGGGAGTGSGPSLDDAEKVHLLFMRAEEKLAHDVYVTLDAEFSDDTDVFSNIVDSETKHVETMIKMIEKFGLADPIINNDPGEFNADNYSDYFTYNYNYMIDVYAAEIPLLQAMLNGAWIEELDMHDIVYCPDIIVETVGLDEDGCGREYTGTKALIQSYGNLLDGSENHLRAFVRAIETTFPEEYPYQAQYLTQEEVDAILGGR